jgi:hypothetical protein
MARPTTFWAPVHRVLQRWGNPAASGFPLNAAPSMDFLASGVQDHRWPYNARGSSAAQPGVLGWYAPASIMVANFVPAVAAAANIAAAQIVANGTAMTLAAASGAGIIVASAAAPASFYPAGLSLTAGCVIDALPTLAAFGTAGDFNTSFFDRATCVGRCVSVTAPAGATGGGVLIKGYDVYGYPMSQLVTAVAGITVNSLKAFKAVISATPQFTDAAHNYSVGVADTFGLGILASYWGDLDVTWNNAYVTASTGFTAADATSPATTTTSDVRGTYAVQSPSDGVKRLQISVTPTLGTIKTNPTTGLFGQPQV